jgi:hypothetical protein
MTGRMKLFLTIEEAREAVRLAFIQYPSQLNLLSVLWPMVFGDDAYVLHGDGHQPVWAKVPGETKLIPSSESDLKRRIIDRLRQIPPSPQRLARICAQVFGVKAVVCPDQKPTLPDGIWIDTDMDGFVCIRCGHCCRTLNYRDGCSVDDYKHWQALGRTDIIRWVGTVKRHGEIVACRIWMEPGTNRYAECCPWLKVVDQSGLTRCTIHDVRPTICRQYPGSRKHARMTGCRGV